MSKRNRDEKLIENYQNYSSDNDPTGEIGHRLADAVTKMAKSERKDISHWLSEKRQAGILKTHSPKGEPSQSEVAKIIYDAVSKQRIPMADAVSLVRKVLEDNNYHKIPFNLEYIPTSKAKDGMIVAYAKYMLHKYNFPVEPYLNTYKE